MDWIRLGGWEFRPEDVVALRHGRDGLPLAVYLHSGLEIPLDPDEAAAFMSHFDRDRVVIAVSPPGPVLGRRGGVRDRSGDEPPASADDPEAAGPGGRRAYREPVGRE